MKKTQKNTEAIHSKIYYRIIHNIEDHLEYNNEPVYIVKKLPDGYFIVSNDAGTQWQCGEEELKAIQDKGNGHTPGEWTYDKKKCAIISDYKEEFQEYDTVIVSLFGAMGGVNTEADAQLIASAPQLKAQNESLAWDVNRLAVDNQEKEDTINELLAMLNEIRDSYWDLMTRETTDKIDAAIQKTTK